MSSIVKYVTGLFSEEKKEYSLRKGEVEVRTTWFRDRVSYYWDTLTVNELKILMQDAYLVNYSWRLDHRSCIVDRMLGDYYKSTTSLIEHTKLAGLNDACGIVLSSQQYTGLKRILS